jgi:hypothetical protein
MSLFECTECHCVENTAVGFYWEAQLKGQDPKCSECHTGEWHGIFPKWSAKGWYRDANNGLWRNEEECPVHMRKKGSRK